jgi:hypothetical protein
MKTPEHRVELNQPILAAAGAPQRGSLPSRLVAATSAVTNR